MKKPSSPNYRNVAIGLLSCWAAVSCFGTETDNPVTSNTPGLDYASPDHFGPPPNEPPGCVPPDPESEPLLPRTYGRPVVVSTAQGPVLAQSDRQGVVFADVSDPLAPRVSSRGVAPGLYDALPGPDGVLWGIVSEPLDVSGAALPEVEALDFHTRLIQLDVSDPTQPARVAQIDLEGEPWALRARGDEVWVATARRTAEQRACDAPKGALTCAVPQYEALVVRGFRSSGGALEPIAQAELPFSLRAWWGPSGIVSAAGGALHLLRWDENGVLSAPISVELPSPEPGTEPSGELAIGPAEVFGRQLRVVQATGDRSRLLVYDLVTGGEPSPYSLDPGVVPSVRSLLHESYLWVEPLASDQPAVVWDLSSAFPARVTLPADYRGVLPITGASIDNPGGEVRALAWTSDANGTPIGALLSISGGTASVIASGVDVWTPDAFGTVGPAPAGLVGPGGFEKWRLSLPGPALPLELQPDVLLPPEPDVRASVAVPNAAGTLVSATLQIASVPVGSGSATTLEVQLAFDGAEPFALSPDTLDLVATRRHVVTLDTTDLRQCAFTGEDCSARSPGVSIFTVTDAPTHVATLPLPELPLPVSTSPDQVNISWQIYDPLTRSSAIGLRLGDERLALVAQVDLSCDTQDTCDALGIEALPISEANVVTGAMVACPPNDLDPSCVPMPAPEPSVYGSSQRQYFYVLDLEAPGGPAWQSWGTSSLESSTARRDRGGHSSFAAPIASDGVLAATRLERQAASGLLLPEGTSRFMLDRFALDAQGSPRALPPVNVPGYPVARLAADGGSESWVAVEATSDASGHARVLRLGIDGDGAHIDDQLALDAGTFAGMRVIEAESGPVGIALLAPADACGTTRVAAVRLGPGDAPLSLAGQLELPEDEWTFSASDGAYVLLRHAPVYLLLHVAADGGPSVAGSATGSLGNEQLIGTTLFGASSAGPERIDLAL